MAGAGAGTGAGAGVRAGAVTGAGAGVGVVWSSQTPTTDRESRCTVHKGGTRFAEGSPVTNDSDVQDSQKLGSMCFKRGLVPRTYPYWARLLHHRRRGESMAGGGESG
eukprot:1183981-Prorocentrum_minimum.AAC.1